MRTRSKVIAGVAGCVALGIAALFATCPSGDEALLLEDRASMSTAAEEVWAAIKSPASHAACTRSSLTSAASTRSGRPAGAT